MWPCTEVWPYMDYVRIDCITGLLHLHSDLWLLFNGRQRYKLSLYLIWSLNMLHLWNLPPCKAKQLHCPIYYVKLSSDLNPGWIYKYKVPIKNCFETRTLISCTNLFFIDFLSNKWMLCKSWSSKMTTWPGWLRKQCWYGYLGQGTVIKKIIVLMNSHLRGSSCL